MQDSIVVLMLPKSLCRSRDSLLDPVSSAIDISLPSKSISETTYSFALWDIEELLEKHGLSDLNGFAIGGISTPYIDPNGRAR